MTTIAQLPTVDPQSVKDGSALWSSQGYIDGLRLAWVSGTSLSVTSGRAYVPSLGRTLELPATYTLSGLSLTASTWYHAYLYLDGSTPKVELVTTAPSAPYYGTARAKTGDTSRRYIGSVRTDASGAIYRFLHHPQSGEMAYAVNPGVAPFRIISSGNATTPTLMDLSAVIPITSEFGSFKLTNFDSSVTVIVYLDSSGSTVLFNASARQSLFCYSPALGRQLYYAYAAAPSGPQFAFFDVRGYRFER